MAALSLHWLIEFGIFNKQYKNYSYVYLKNNGKNEYDIHIKKQALKNYSVTIVYMYTWVTQ